MSSVLIIGYGNSLRRDDGVGPWVATRADAILKPAATGLAVYQLTPELAESVARVGWVVFVDAQPAVTGFERHEIGPTGERPIALAHTGSPEALLTMTARLFGRTPRATLIGIEAHDFAFGEGLSKTTALAAQQALTWLCTEASRFAQDSIAAWTCSGTRQAEMA